MRRQPIVTTRHAGERGTGLLGTAIGVAMMIALLGFAANVTLGLWVRSTVDAAAYEAARRVATSGVGTSDQAELRNVESLAVRDARRMLGSFGDRVRFQFRDGFDAERVVLEVHSPGISLLPRMITGGTVVGPLDRRFVIRREGM